MRDLRVILDTEISIKKANKFCVQHWLTDYTFNILAAGHFGTINVKVVFFIKIMM